MGGFGDGSVDAAPPGPLTRGREKTTAFIDFIHGRFSCCEENLRAASRSADVFVTYGS